MPPSLPDKERLEVKAGADIVGPIHAMIRQRAENEAVRMSTNLGNQAVHAAAIERNTANPPISYNNT